MLGFRRQVFVGALVLGALVPAGAAQAQHEPFQEVSRGGANGLVGLDAQGTATEVWVDHPARSAIRYAVRGVDGAFGFVRAVPGVVSVSELAFAEASDGRAIVVWTEYGELKAAVRPAAGALFGRGTVIGGSSTVDNSAHFPDVAVSDSGRAIVSWLDNEDDVHAVLYDGAWGTDATLATSAGDPDAPEAGIDGAGNALVVWEKRAATTQIQGAAAPAGGGFGPATTLVDLDQSFTSNPELAVNADGDALLAYLDDSAVIARTGDVSGTLGPQQTIVAPPEETAYNWEVALDPSGLGGIVVGVVAGGGDASVEAAVTNPGGSFGPRQVLSPGETITGPTIGEREMEIAAGGGEFSVWFANDHENRGDVNRVWTSTTTGGTFGAIHELSPESTTADSPDTVHGARNDAGAAIGTWSMWDGEDYVVQASPVVPDTVDPTASATAKPDPYTAGDGKLKVRFQPSEEVVATVVITRDGRKVATLMKKKLVPGDAQSVATWNGKDGRHLADPGKYKFRVSMVDAAGNKGSETGSFTVR